MLLYLMELEQWNAWIQMIGEAVGHGLMQRRNGNRVCIDVDVAENRERSQVVNSRYMIIMAVGKKHSVKFLERKGHQLHPDVRSAVDQ